MRVFVYNMKDESVAAKALNLGEITEVEVATLNKVFDWLYENDVLPKYYSLALAEGYHHEVNEDGEDYVYFHEVQLEGDGGGDSL